MLKRLESGFREYDSSLEIRFIKAVCMGYALWREKGRLQWKKTPKSFLLLRLAVFLLRYHSFSAAGKATPVYIIL